MTVATQFRPTQQSLPVVETTITTTNSSVASTTLPWKQVDDEPHITAATTTTTTTTISSPTPTQTPHTLLQTNEEIVATTSSSSGSTMTANQPYATTTTTAPITTHKHFVGPSQLLLEDPTHVTLRDDTSMNISRSTQVGVLVEREVGKLTRHCRMLGGEEETKECDIEDDANLEEEILLKMDSTYGTGESNDYYFQPQADDQPKTHEYRLPQKQKQQQQQQAPTQAVGDDAQSTTSRRPAEIPQFDRSEIMAWTLLGNGAFSEVYQVWGFRFKEEFHKLASPSQKAAREAVQKTAMSEETQRCNYVIKHLRSDLKASTDKSRFVHAASDLVMEALFLTKLDHANIIKLRGTSHGIETFGNGHHDGFFLLLDRLDCTLADKINCWARSNACRQRVFSRQLVDYAEKVDLAMQIARGLEYLHDRDIVFRDLKPDNIGIQNRRVKIFDFGLCRELPEEKPAENKVYHMSGVGTRRYMAPEIFLTQHYNLKVDVYSFAIVLHCMLSLVRPFEKYNAHLHTLLVCKEGARPPIPYEWPESLCDLLRYGWAHKPSDRPTMKEARILLEKLNGEISRQTPKLPGNGSGTNGIKEQPYSGPDPTPTPADCSASILTSSLRAMDLFSQTLCDDKIQTQAGNAWRSLELQLIEGGVTWAHKQHDQKYLKHLQYKHGRDVQDVTKSKKPRGKNSCEGKPSRHLRSSYL